jgi:hypothetical protein
LEPPLSDFERLLRSSPPKPRAEFVDELERSLVRSLEPQRTSSRASRWRLHRPRLVTAGAFAGAIAVLFVVLAIAGVRPFGTSGTGPAQADRECATVERVVRVRRPLLRVDSEGRPQVTYRVESVKQPFIRCR